MIIHGLECMSENRDHVKCEDEDSCSIRARVGEAIVCYYPNEENGVVLHMDDQTYSKDVEHLQQEPKVTVKQIYLDNIITVYRECQSKGRKYWSGTSKGIDSFNACDKWLDIG